MRLITKYIVLLLLSNLGSKILLAQVKINEIVAINKKSHLNAAGKAYDWIEIYNTSGQAYSLQNHFISDESEDLKKCKILDPTLIVPAKGFLILYASDNISLGKGHLPFSLSGAGEIFIITKPDGKTVLDRLEYPALQEDVSIGRQPDGTNTQVYFKKTSALGSNNTAEAFKGILSPPVFSKKSGFYTEAFPLIISHPTAAVDIIFSKDGSEPSQDALNGKKFKFKNLYPFGQWNNSSFLEDSYLKSEKYKEILAINDINNAPNRSSMYSSTCDEIPEYLPLYKIQKSHIIRARAYKEDYLPSEIASETYFINSKLNLNKDFGVISLAIDEKELFDYEKGIYTAGRAFDTYKGMNPDQAVDICTPGNFSIRGDSVEKEASFSYFKNNSLVYSGNTKLKLHGACTRSLAQKSLRLTARNDFNGTSFFDLSPELTHKSIVIRNGGNDQHLSLIRDIFSQDLMSGFRVSTQKTQLSVLFINGEYWGIQNIRERVDNNYINRLYGVNTSQIDMVKNDWRGPLEFEYGDSLHYRKTEKFIRNTDLKLEDNYREASELIDPENVADYQIGQIFTGNIDWPQNNVKLWRKKTDNYNASATNGHDGRWRYSFFDVEKNLGMFVDAKYNYLERAINHQENWILNSFLKNENFKNEFVNTYLDKLQTVFRSEYADSLYGSWLNRLEPQILEHIKRWKTHNNIQAWWYAASQVRNYLHQRPNAAEQELIAIFELKNKRNINLKTDLDKGFIVLNSLNLNKESRGLVWDKDGSYSGKYFEEAPVKIKAEAKEEFLFKHWLIDGEIFNQNELLITLEKDKKIEAIFEKDPNLGEIKLETLDLTTCGFSLKEWDPYMPFGSSPKHTTFVYMTEKDPKETSKIKGKLAGSYNYKSKSRVSGLDSLGVSFLNTSGPEENPAFPNGKIGGMLLAVNTMFLTEAKVSWKVRSIAIGGRKYALKLKYRVGEKGEFMNFSDNTITQSFTEVGKSQTLEVDLPKEAIGLDKIQLFWQYFYTEQGNSGSRDELALDDISIAVKRNESLYSIALDNPTKDLNFVKLYNEKPEPPKLVSDVNSVCGQQLANLQLSGCFSSQVVWSNSDSTLNLLKVKEGTYKAACKTSCGVSEYSNVLIIARDFRAKEPEITSLKIAIVKGENIVLSAEKCDGQITWNTGQKTEFINVNPSENATYKAKCEHLGCVSDFSKPFAIQVNKLSPPSLSVEKSVFCIGESVIFSASGCPALTEWSNLATGKTTLVNPKKSGSLSIKARCIFNEEKSEWSEFKNVLVNEIASKPKFIQVANIDCKQGGINLDDLILNPGDFNYSFSSSESPNDPVLTDHFQTLSGFYYLHAKDKNGCQISSEKIKILPVPCNTINSTNSNIDLSIKDIKIYPESEKGIYRIETELLNSGTLLQNDQNVYLQVAGQESIKYAYGGKEVYNKEIKINFEPKNGTQKLVFLVQLSENTNSKLNLTIKGTKLFEKNTSNNFKEIEIRNSDDKIGLNLDLKTTENADSLDFDFTMGIENFEANEAIIPEMHFPFKLLSGLNAKLVSIKTPDNFNISNDYIKNGILIKDKLNSLKPNEKLNLNLVFRLKKSDLLNSNFQFYAYLKNGTFYEYSNAGIFADANGDLDPKNDSDPVFYTYSNANNSSSLIFTHTLIDRLHLSTGDSRLTFKAVLKNIGTGTLNQINIKIKQDSSIAILKTHARILGISSFSKKANLSDLGFDKSFYAEVLSLPAGKADTLYYTISVNKNTPNGIYFLQLMADATNEKTELLSKLSNNGPNLNSKNTEPTVLKINNIKEPEIQVSGGFSPNNDGKNDNFWAKIPSGVSLESLTIYDVFGTLLKKFNTSTEFISWDGKLPNNKMVKPGTYFYAYKIKGDINITEGYITVAY